MAVPAGMSEWVWVLPWTDQQGICEADWLKRFTLVTTAVKSFWNTCRPDARHSEPCLPLRPLAHGGGCRGGGEAQRRCAAPLR
jgi:hypothetical protein